MDYTNKGITYTDEFKYKLVKECENSKKLPQDVLENVKLIRKLGELRICNCAYRWKIQLNSTGQIKDTGKENEGRPLEHDLSDKEKLERAEAKIKLLEAENKLFKKRIDRNGNFNKYQINIKFETIKDYIDYYNNYRYQWNKKDDSDTISKSSIRVYCQESLFFIWYLTKSSF